MSSLRWRNLDLNDTTTPFNPNYIYRMYCGGWMIATRISSSVLYFQPSTAGNFFACIHYSHKSEWDYKMKGDCINRPPEYPNYMARVEKLQYIAIEDAE